MNWLSGVIHGESAMLLFDHDVGPRWVTQHL
jgi:hypothetical protein